MPLSPAAEAELRSQARVRAAHYSTFIEGNRLTIAQAKQVVTDGRVQISGRERDVSEVRNYCNALLRVEEWAARNRSLAFPAAPEAADYRQYIGRLSEMDQK